MRRMTLTTVAAALLALPTLAAAAVVQADFNDLAGGTDVKTQSGGVGFSGAWDGSTNPDVQSGDLTAPLATNFNLTQSGTAQSVRGDATSGAVQRNVSTAMTGTVWFSYLVNQVAGARGGIELNPTLGNTSSSGQRIIAVDNNLRLIVGGTDVAANGVFTYGQTALVLGRLDINTAGADTLWVWVNPDTLNLGAATKIVTGFNIITTSITTLGIESYYSGGDNQGGTVDLVTFADGPGAYAAVTGVPTPAALPAGLALMGLLVIRRRNSQF